MAELKSDPNFNYHPRYERLNISHMRFASDLLLLARADPTSVGLIHKAFMKWVVS